MFSFFTEQPVSLFFDEHPDAPHADWTCLFVVDARKHKFWPTRCEICGRRGLYYTYTLTHLEEYYSLVNACLVCTRTLARDCPLDSRSWKRRLTKLGAFIHTDWDFDDSGQEYLDIDRCRLRVHPLTNCVDRWTWEIDLEDGDTLRTESGYFSADHAKLATFREWLIAVRDKRAKLPYEFVDSEPSESGE